MKRLAIILVLWITPTFADNLADAITFCDQHSDEPKWQHHCAALKQAVATMQQQKLGGNMIMPGK